MRVLIIYHSADLDGIFSGILLETEARKSKFSFTSIGYHYGEPFELSQILSYDQVWIADVCFDIQTMLKIARKCKLVWFDHHETAYQDYLKLRKEFELEGAEVYFPDRDDWKRSTTDVIWRYKTGEYPTYENDKNLYLLGRYDVFDKSDIELWNNEILPLQRLLNVLLTCPKDFYEIEPYLPKSEEDWLRLGKKMIDKERKLAQKNYHKLFYREFRGKKVLVSNIGKSVLDFYFSENPDCADFLATIQMTGDGYVYGFYSGTDTSLNLGAIAKEYGGGGHAGAAGFTSKQLIF